MKTNKKAESKKIVVISMGDVRDVSWEDAAALGLELMRNMRVSDFKPTALSPYVIDGGDVPLLILVEVEDSEKVVEKKIDLLKSIVDDRADFNVLDDESEYWWTE